VNRHLDVTASGAYRIAGQHWIAWAKVGAAAHHADVLSRVHCSVLSTDHEETPNLRPG